MDADQIRTLQFELWQECNNKCDFCYLGKENRRTDDAIKIQSLNKALSSISDMANYPKFNCIGFIGGEFFQGQLANPEVKRLFYQLIKKAAELYNSKIIKQVWISATLTIGNQSELYEILSFFNDYDGVWIITSWDTIGRFKTDKMLNNWKYHIKQLTEKFPNIKINITTILTGDMIDKYLAGEISFANMMKRYNATFFFKQCGSIVDWKGRGDYDEVRAAKTQSNQLLPNFFPTKSKFIQFLIKFKTQETEDMWTRLFNIQFRANNLIRNYNDGHSDLNIRLKNTRSEVDEVNHMECGHPFVYSAYIDCDDCCLCDKLKLSSFE